MGVGQNNMRNRLEDLGRLSEILHRLSQHEAFNHVDHYGFEKFVEWIQDIDNADELRSNLDHLKHELSEAWCIARWGDSEEDDDYHRSCRSLEFD